METIQYGNIVVDLAAPVISGDPAVGETLTLDPGSWPSDVAIQTRWLLDGVPIPGATGASYTPQASDWSDDISAQVVATRPANSH